MTRSTNAGLMLGHVNESDVLVTDLVFSPPEALKVIYHPLYGMNNYVLIWGDRLSCDPLNHPI